MSSQPSLSFASKETTSQGLKDLIWERTGRIIKDPLLTQIEISSKGSKVSFHFNF